MKQYIKTNNLTQDDVVVVKGRDDKHNVVFKILEGDSWRLATVFSTYSTLRGRERGISHTFLVDENQSCKQLINSWKNHPDYDYKSLSLWTKFDDLKRLDSVVSGVGYLRHFFLDDDGIVRFTALSNSPDSYYDIDFAVTRFPTLARLHHVVVDEKMRLEILE